MRSLILLILGLSAASAGGYFYRDNIPGQYRFWESSQVVELKKQIVEKLNPEPVEVAALETIPLTRPLEQLKLEKATSTTDQALAPTPIVEQVTPPLADESVVTEAVQQVEKDARSYVSDLSSVPKPSVPVKKADHFVSAHQLLDLLKDDALVELISPLSSKPVIHALAPRERSVISTLDSNLATEAVKELVLIQTSSSEDLKPLFSLESEQRDSTEPVIIVREAKAVMPVLPELVQPARVEETDSLATRASNKNNPQITIAELLKHEEPAKEGSIYYVRTVKQSDSQGIWGIIVDGLTENFASGIAISRDESVDTFQVNIPSLADDMLDDNTSSFLGKLVDRKTRECFVYNFVEKKIGRNPDLIYPGQELLIINFEADELIDIYTHFVENS